MQCSQPLQLCPEVDSSHLEAGLLLYVDTLQNIFDKLKDLNDLLSNG